MITEFLKRPIAYQPVLAKAFGSVKLGILWSQLYYWHDKGSDDDGWIYKTQGDIYDETGLSRREQETARKIGRKLAVLEEKYDGSKSRMYFRVDIEKTTEVINQFFSTTEQEAFPIMRTKTPGEESREFFDKGDVYADIVLMLEKNGFNNEQAYTELEKFIAYWTEPNKSGKATRWEMQKTFDVKRRLKTWLMNTQKFNSFSQSQKTGIVL